MSHIERPVKSMKDGFIKCAAAGVSIRVADTDYNTDRIIEKIEECIKNKAKIIVFPQLVISGCTCGDLFFQEALLEGCKEGLKKIMAFSADKEALIFIGLPFSLRGRLYNVAAAVWNGKLLGMVPQSVISRSGEGTGAEHFMPGPKKPVTIEFDGQKVPFGVNQLFETTTGLCVACEIGEDAGAIINPGTYHAGMGANVIVHLAASCELVGRRESQKRYMQAASERLLCAYVCANAGDGESTQDLVFGGSHLIVEKGRVLAEAKTFENETIYGDVDIHLLMGMRQRNAADVPDLCTDYVRTEFVLTIEETHLERKIEKLPFVPNEEEQRRKRCEEIFEIQANGLKKRLEHTRCKHAVVGVSGGLDSTLAMLVVVRAFDLLKMDRANIRAITMPCFGTTDRTYDNACLLARTLGCTLQEVDIRESVKQHFADIGQSMDNHDVTYENAQARERTQVLMDIANQCGGMVIGTGDLSELALGWATYNGDHMSMYGVNGAIPKTLVRHLVHFYANHCCDENDKLKEVLLDVLDTPVSPELLPPVDGAIAQKTEDLVGPYELHDFFLYYILRHGFSPAKIFRLAKIAFAGEYEDDTIIKWLKKFYYRFFAQQFKRSCLPDGPKVGTVGVSPRGDLRMPSDACVSVWMKEAESLE